MGGVRAWAAKRIGALVSSLKPPDVALAAVTLRGADLHATLTGESIPRHVQNIDLKLRFGRDYRSLTLDLTGALHLSCLVPQLCDACLHLLTHSSPTENLSISVFVRSFQK